MSELAETAPAFVQMAHRIVWATVATVDRAGRPRSRVLHPIWEWDGTTLVGRIATDPAGLKRAHVDRVPSVSVHYWDPTHDTCTAECDARFDDRPEARAALWERFASAPEPVGYDPTIIPGWTSPDAPTFGVLVLELAFVAWAAVQKARLFW